MKTKNNKSILISFLSLLAWVNHSNAQSIAAGGWHSLSVCKDSTVKAFGENASGQLGDSSSTDRNTPVLVKGLTGIISVSGGGDQLEAHSLALKSNGTVWAWGSNIYGGLGNGNTTNTKVAGQVLVLSDVKAISAGGWHSVALKKDNTVWVWGWNMDGQLGDGTNVDKSTPKQISGLSGIKAIAAGTYHTLVLKSDSTVWAWGDNISGQIGDGTTTDRNTPVQVSGLKGVVAIAAGRFFSLAVKRDGTVWTWGENLYGQLGDGTTTDRHTPVKVSGLTGITSAVAATGAFHCMAVKNDNTVWSWGRNTYGNLGDSSIVNRLTPVKMSGISDIAGLAAGTNFSLLYKKDGTFWGCGRNASGQLGDGTVIQRNNVTQATSLCSVLQPGAVAKLDKYNSIQISAFPNPSTTGIFTMKVSDINTKISGGEIEVSSVLGAKVFQSDLAENEKGSTIAIDLSDQPNGIYYLALKSENQNYYQKLVKQ